MNKYTIIGGGPAGRDIRDRRHGRGGKRSHVGELLPEYFIPLCPGEYRLAHYQRQFPAADVSAG